MIQISVVVATYNQEWDALRRTLYSILIQKDVCFEIIITDDGSSYNHFSEADNYFLKFGFKHYVLLEHKHNKGTVNNFLDGVKQAKGKYVKGISPGDFLYEKDTLNRFYNYAESHQADAYFGKALYYSYQNNIVHIFKDKQNPQNLIPWQKKYRCQARYNYIGKKDYALGASFFVRKDTFLNYLIRIKNNIKYTEDYVFVMMISENKKVVFIDRTIVFYEYGTGISTNGQSDWSQCISHDNKVGLQMIWNSLTFAEKTEIQNKNKFTYKLLGYILSPQLILYRLKEKRNEKKEIRVLYREKDLLFLQKILEQ